MAKHKQDLSALIGKAKQTQLQTPVQKVVPVIASKEIIAVKEKQVNFPFNVEQDRIEYLRELVLYKRRSDPEFFHYSNTHAVKEGIGYLREIYPDVEQRPASLKYSTRNGTLGHLNGVEKVKTTFSISTTDKEFIYNLIYKKDANTGEYNKADLFDELLEELHKVYPEVQKPF
ncbi:hypothetical protein DBR28_08670 [Chryseobacterium sp. HMWF028]|nr:hypothetical protein DBR28_08670 [Chryseobacterium sp. HMWF028]